MERRKGGKPLILTFLRFVIPSIISMWIFAFYTINDSFLNIFWIIFFSKNYILT